jgi:LysM repeat protein
VKQGETLSEIAAQYEVSIQAIMEANGLTDPNRIVTGQELIIPEPEPSTPTTNPPTS